MNPTLAKIVVRRLDHAFPVPWREETRDEFARSLARVEADERQALAAVDRAKEHRRFRPTVAEFMADVVAVRQTDAREALTAPVRGSVTDLDKAAAEWFPARLRAVLGSYEVGDGPGPAGLDEACRKVASDFWAARRDEGDF